MIQLRCIFTTTLFLLLLTQITAQDLVNSRRTSHYRFIYQISQNQAKQIHTKGLETVDQTFFYHLIDSIPLDSTFTQKLPQGNYLSVWVDDNQLHYQFRSYSDIDLILHNNYADLSFSLRDKNGILINNARAKYKRRHIAFDPKTQCYLLPKKQIKGMIEVEHDGFISYFYLDNHAGKVSLSRKILYSFPLKYVTIPVKLVLCLPYDIYRSIRHRGLYGLPYYVTKPFKDIYYSIYNGYPQGFVDKLANRFNRERKWDYGYMVYSKPKYRPNDTVRVKAFITNKNCKPYNKCLNVYYYNKGYKLLGEAKHSNKGNYQFTLPLHDSLDLKLDNYVELYFGPNPWVHLASSSFYYEDYELKEISYNLRCDETNYFPGDKITLYAKGEDMNGYAIQDGKVEIVVKPGKKQSRFEGKLLYLPDTIWTKQMPLKQSGETRIVIPDSIFKPINSDYTAEAIFTNASNERTIKKAFFNFWQIKEEISIQKEADSLRIKYLNLNQSQTRRAYIQHQDINNNVLKGYWSSLPCQIKLDPNISHYTVTSGDLQKVFYLKDNLPGLTFSIDRNHKQINLAAINPENIPFKYYLYNKKHEIERSCTTHLDTLINANNKNNYFLSVQYEWGSQSHTMNYTIPLLEKQLNVEIEQPAKIYPGQHTEIKIKATDYRGRPVENVDLTAMGLTRKFNFTPPQVPIFEKKKKERIIRNDYVNNGNVLFGESSTDSLDYQIWNEVMKLDTIEFFRFCHPAYGYYQTTWPANNNQTQLAPFVFKKGELQQAHIIWINNSIVYASISTNNPPYSFKCSEGYHSISIRTRDYDILIDSVEVIKGMKNILSIDVDSNTNAKITKTKNVFSQNEKNLLSSAFARFQISGNQLIYTRQLDNYNILNNTGNYHYHNYVIAGPYHQLGQLHYVGNHKRYFDYEPHYEYSINGNVVKMKTDNSINSLLSRILQNKRTIPPLTDELWTQTEIDHLTELNKTKTIAQNVYFRNPWSTKKGNTQLKLNYNQKEGKELILYTLLFSNDPEFVRIYNGRQRNFHDLKEGFYRLVMVYSNNRCFELDSLNLIKGGRHFLQVNEPDSLSKNMNLDYLTQLISQKRQLTAADNYTEEKIKQSILNNYNPDVSYNNTISGYIYDDAGMPMPGVNVMLKGTTHGTISNIDGYYQLNVPSGTPELSFSFVGFESKGIRVGFDNHKDIRLQADECEVEEVVVVGYGTQKKYSLTGSVTTVKSALQGRTAGLSLVNSYGITGASPKIMIRGISSLKPDKQPLYIIDGVPYEGDLNDLNIQNIADIKVLKDESATAIYGARAANGVIILTLKSNTVIPFKKVTIEESIPLILPTDNKSLRTNFNDAAYWQPALQTDKNGEASFKVTFPDDITSWDTHVMAMSDKGQTANWSGNIKAFLPLSANLVTPRFATEGDNITIIGKTINYLPDSVETKRCFKQKDTIAYSKEGWINKIEIDSMAVNIASTDTLTLEYSITKGEFRDGEKRNIPIIPLGSFDNIGQFAVLQSDTTITWTLDNNAETHFYIESNPLNLLHRETKKLRRYKYLCNEQTASKLIGLLAEKQICEALGQKFKYESDIKALIKRLNKSKNNEALWGWWSGNSTSYWISQHVVKALSMAKLDGYETEMDDQALARHLVVCLKRKHLLLETVELLNTLIRLDSISNYTSHIDGLIKQCRSFNDSLSVYNLRQQMGYKDDISKLVNKHQTTLFGSVYWGRRHYYLFNNDLLQTIRMYELIKNSGQHTDMLPKIRQWFFEQRDKQGWINTYYRSSIIAGLIPDLIKNIVVDQKDTLEISRNGYYEQVDQLPYEATISGTQKISIKKTGKQVIFAGYDQKVFNPAPQPKNEYFNIQSRWLENGDEVTTLKAGNKYELEVSIDVKNKSDYLILEIPVPAGCSYANKNNRGFGEAYREYFKEKVNIYFHSLKPGTYTKTIELVPRFNGKFNLNPAQMQQMYFPLFYGRNGIQKVEVKTGE